VTASRLLSRVFGLRGVVFAALLASACQHDADAVFDDSNLTPGDRAGSSSTGGADAAGTAAVGGATDDGDAAGGTNSTGGKASGGASMGGKGSGGKGGTGGSAGQTGMGGKAGSGGNGGGSGGAGTAGMAGMPTTDPEPVTVDITDIADTQVSSCNPNQNFGEAISMNVDGDNFCTLYMLINPSLAEVPESALVSEATLTLNCTNVGGAVTVSYVADTWGEDTVRWNNRPDVGTSFATFTCEQGGAVTIDLTAAVTAWLAGTRKPYGVYFRTEDSDGSDYDTSEAVNGTPPVLSVTYTLPVK
jgi:hypothetical protein